MTRCRGVFGILLFLLAPSFSRSSPRLRGTTPAPDPTMTPLPHTESADAAAEHDAAHTTTTTAGSADATALRPRSRLDILARPLTTNLTRSCCGPLGMLVLFLFLHSACLACSSQNFLESIPHMLMLVRERQGAQGQGRFWGSTPPVGHETSSMESVPAGATGPGDHNPASSIVNTSDHTATPALTEAADAGMIPSDAIVLVGNGPLSPEQKEQINSAPGDDSLVLRCNHCPAVEAATDRLDILLRGPGARENPFEDELVGEVWQLQFHGFDAMRDCLSQAFGSGGTDESAAGRGRRIVHRLDSQEDDQWRRLKTNILREALGGTVLDEAEEKLRSPLEKDITTLRELRELVADLPKTDVAKLPLLDQRFSEWFAGPLGERFSTGFKGILILVAALQGGAGAAGALSDPISGRFASRLRAIHVFGFSFATNVEGMLATQLEKALADVFASRGWITVHAVDQVKNGSLYHHGDAPDLETIAEDSVRRLGQVDAAFLHQKLQNAKRAGLVERYGIIDHPVKSFVLVVVLRTSNYVGLDGLHTPAERIIQKWQEGADEHGVRYHSYSFRFSESLERNDDMAVWAMRRPWNEF